MIINSSLCYWPLCKAMVLLNLWRTPLMFRRPDIDTAAVRINYRSVVSGLAETVYCSLPTTTCMRTACVWARMRTRCVRVRWRATTRSLGLCLNEPAKVGTGQVQDMVVSSRGLRLLCKRSLLFYIKHVCKYMYICFSRRKDFSIRTLLCL